MFASIDEINDQFDVVSSLEGLYLNTDEELSGIFCKIRGLLKEDGFLIFTNGFNLKNPNVVKRCLQANEMYGDEVPVVVRDIEDFINIISPIFSKVGVMSMGKSDYPYFGVTSSDELALIEAEFAAHDIFVCYK
jgi:hypothetical protein